ncbi:MAG: hypothetical protein AAGG48_13655 [Planctomycetota bacterium]
MLRPKSIALLATLFLLGSGQVEANETTASEAEVSQLIDLLGADSYATRVRARERLQRMGLEAFDELHDAQFHRDTEIAMAARFLVSSLSISWSKETDPPEVRDVLIEYGAQNEIERSTRIDMLSEFKERKALAAITRLVRFETSLRLSRRAAIAIMQQPMSDVSATRVSNSKQITDTLGDNDRQASEWLRVYASDLASGEYAADRWNDLIDQQRLEIDSGSTQQASRSSVLELVRVTATRAAKAGLTDEALRLATKNMDLITPKSSDLVDAASWAIDNDLHPFVIELQKEHGAMFSRHPMLLYAAAEAFNTADDKKQAEYLAGRAAQINPLPQSEEERAASKMQPADIDDTAQAHRELGIKLKERGLYKWAEREFRLIIDALDLEDERAATARGDLAEMLGELERHQDLIDLLEPLAERVEKDNQLRRRLNSRVLWQYNRVQSDVDFHKALLALKQGKDDEARPLLINAYRMYRINVDILIRMYRTDGDEEWRKLVSRELRSAISDAESSVQQAKMQVRQLGEAAEPSLAQFLNQYAWLVCNTEGDYQKALNYSLQSLELQTDSARLDTCARCYFAVGDLENAIVTQKRALRLEPHSPPLQRQLAEFEAAYEAAKEE